MKKTYWRGLCVLSLFLLAACPPGPDTGDGGGGGPDGGGAMDGGAMDGGGGTGPDGGGSMDGGGGSPDGGGPDGGGTSLDFDALCQDFATSICGFFSRCFGLPPEVAQVRCEAQFDEQCHSGIASQLQPALEDGRSVFDQSAYDACLDLLATGDCRSLEGSGGTPCDEIFQGTVPLGGACYIADPSNTDCAEGYCDTSTSTCPGTCTAFGGIGESCANGPCDETVAFCNDQSVCEAYRGENSPCTRSGECQPNLTCRSLDGGATTVCTTPAADGEACTQDEECASGRCGPTDTCLTVPAAQGAPCQVNTDCQAGDVCDFDGMNGFVCMAPKQMGEACYTPFSCAAGLICEGAGAGGGTCQPIPQLGETCSQFCAGNAWCDTTLNPPTCVAPGKAGNHCSNADFFPTCESGLFCNDQEVCQAKLATGESCTGDTQCQSGVCDGATQKCAEVCLPQG
ncbi:MAG: hypothetical protein D6729_01045 [Deltaproteobacteria bacterium]|nr:MAG: hypothetical protein D6729_01045 [Deltaproteobacteria bacterium]